MTHQNSNPDSNRTSADLMGANNAYASGYPTAGGAGDRRSSVMDPVGDNVYDRSGRQSVADHNAFVRDGREAEYGNGNGNGYGSRPASGMGHTPSYRRSQYGGSTRGYGGGNGNGAGVGAGRYYG